MTASYFPRGEGTIWWGEGGIAVSLLQPCHTSPLLPSPIPPSRPLAPIATLIALRGAVGFF